MILESTIEMYNLNRRLTALLLLLIFKYLGLPRILYLSQS